MEEKIVYLKTKDLKNNPNNPRKNDEAVDSVAKSIEKYGFRNPLIIDTNNVVWCGNTRLKASRKLGLETVPCIVVSDLTEQQMKELALLDNKTNEISEWDFDLLGDILKETEIDDFGFDWGVVEDDGFGTDFDLASGDKIPLMTMSITFSEEQAEQVNEAIRQMKQSDTYKNYKDEINENSNGNALYLIVLEWLNGNR